MVSWPDTHLIDVNSEVNSENSTCEDKVWVINRQIWRLCLVENEYLVNMRESTDFYLVVDKNILDREYHRQIMREWEVKDGILG